MIFSPNIVTRAQFADWLLLQEEMACDKCPDDQANDFVAALRNGDMPDAKHWSYVAAEPFNSLTLIDDGDHTYLVIETGLLTDKLTSGDAEARSE
tara:strand:- start:405 stop:689 length:285 start_codon:yes stop_codon:yes gene_type:complete